MGLTQTATGKVWAAFLPRQLVSKRITAELRQAKSGAALRDLELEFTRIRTAGFAGTDGSPWPGIAAACAPVFDYTGQIQLAVALLGPLGGIRLQRRQPADRCPARLHARPVEPAGTCGAAYLGGAYFNGPIQRDGQLVKVR